MWAAIWILVIILIIWDIYEFFNQDKIDKIIYDKTSKDVNFGRYKR